LKPALVIGGGIAGMQSALDLADQGIKVFLVEKEPSLGGRMAQLDKTFPTLDCSSCILTPKMVDVSRHENIEMMTYSEVQEINGSKGDFNVKVLQKARFVNMETCTGCGICIEKCPRKSPSEFDEKTGMRKVVYFPFPQAIPLVPVIEEKSCTFFKNGKCKACLKYCPTGAIDFEQKEEIVNLNVGAIIYATGLNLYDPLPTNEFGYGLYDDIVTSLEFERMISSTGPTEGHLKRKSDGKTPKKVAIILCVGSRSQISNWYCSRYCCMASIKQAILIKDHYPTTDISIFYMDIRAFGKGFQEFYHRAEHEYKINFVKGKVGKVSQENGSVQLRYEDIDNGVLGKENFDMVILAVGSEPSNRNYPIPLKVEDDGFIAVNDIHLEPVSTNIDGVFVAGAAEGPKDIPDTVVQAGAAALQASIVLRGN
jgi:heterodisulfide reductase subunit A